MTNKPVAESRPPLSPGEKQILKQIRMLQVFALVSMQIVRALEHTTPYAPTLARIRLRLSAIARDARILEGRRRRGHVGQPVAPGSPASPPAPLGKTLH